MSDELRFVHRKETFNDLAVRELAKSRAACMCRIQFGRCTKNECRTCAVNKRFAHCYNELSDYDKQRVHSYTAEKWLEDSRDPSAWCSFSQLILRGFGMVFLVIIFFALFALVLFALDYVIDIPGDKPLSDVDMYIIETMKEARSIVADLNNDGLVNCIDYACSFKLSWDKLFPKYKGWCSIVRNYNPTNGFNHLFIRVRGSDGVVYVEAWAKNINKYTMEENWPAGRYDPKYNMYGETWLWLSKVHVE